MNATNLLNKSMNYTLSKKSKLKFIKLFYYFFGLYWSSILQNRRLFLLVFLSSLISTLIFVRLGGINFQVFFGFTNSIFISFIIFIIISCLKWNSQTLYSDLKETYVNYLLDILSINFIVLSVVFLLSIMYEGPKAGISNYLLFLLNLTIFLLSFLVQGLSSRVNFLYLKKINPKGVFKDDFHKADNAVYKGIKKIDSNNDFYKKKLSNEYRNAIAVTRKNPISLYLSKGVHNGYISIGVDSMCQDLGIASSVVIYINNKEFKNVNISSREWIEIELSSKSEISSITINASEDTRCYVTSLNTRKIKKDHSNIIILILDGLRKDLIGIYNGNKSDTPNINNFFEKSDVYHNAYTQAEWTLPVFSSYMTSMYSSDHEMTSPNYNIELPNNIKILSEVMQENYFNTMGYSGAFRTSPHFGFARGFDEYTSKNDYKKNRCEEIIDKAMRFMKKNQNQNNFLFLHIMDTHPPYYLNNQIKSNIKGADERNPDLNNITDAQITVNKVDKSLQRLFSSISKHDSVILLADHGVNLSDDKANKGIDAYKWYEKHLSKERINVPLLVKSNKIDKKNVSNTKIVESAVGLFPSVLELANIQHECQSYSESFINSKENNQKGKGYAISELVFGDDYHCNITTLKTQYIRRFNKSNETLVDNSKSFKNGEIQEFNRLIDELNLPKLIDKNEK